MVICYKYKYNTCIKHTHTQIKTEHEFERAWVGGCSVRSRKGKGRERGKRIIIF